VHEKSTRPIRRLALTSCAISLLFAGLGVSGCGGSSASTAALPASRVVAVDGGSVRGLRQGSVSIYKGIPFAAPPVGALRWHPPQPVKPWQGVRECVSYAPACPQQNVPGLGHRARGPQSEDCLYLNVWTPAHAAGERLPVMVWIHGGGFVCGSGSLPGRQAMSLSTRGHVVLVSINYRLGIFGYFALAALSRESADQVSGNYGLLDQVAALRWVHRNIAAFGGDPRRVTIFGESAGGQSVIALLVSPLSRGLFAGAIAESPRYEDQGIGTWSTRPLGVQVAEDEAIAAGLGAPAGPGQLTALRGLSPARLLKAATPAPRALAAVFSEPPHPSFQPVIDGHVLPDEPWDMLRRGDWARVPVIVGSNQD
jgi:para-nitrobenzyl esterase